MLSRLLLAVSLLISTISSSAEPLYPYKVEAKLDDFNQITINWRADRDLERVSFALECSLESDVEWLAFGFSQHGQYDGSDVGLWIGMELMFDPSYPVGLRWDVGLQYRGAPYSMQDGHIESRGSIRADREQNWHLENVDRFPDGRMTLFFWRPFDPCDDDGSSYVIEHLSPALQEGTTHLVLAVGKTRRLNVFGEHVLKLIQPVRLLQTTPAPSIRMSERVETLEVVARNVTVPARETTYWCTIVKLPKMESKRHIIKYEAAIQKGNEEFVHHMEVYHCERPPMPTTGRWRFPMYNGECRVPGVPRLINGCRRVIGAWAMGAPPLVYPEEAGAPIGGHGYFPFVMLETHYNNPGEKAGHVDSSGIRFHYTSELRQFDAGVVEVGLEYTDKMAIPPAQPAFTLTGYCTPECTDALVPNRGITLFASQLHSHLTGRQLSTSVFREGVELAVVNRDRHYSTHWQEIRPVDRLTVLPGDALVTTCVYDTQVRRNVTLGGYGITDEMCVNYIHYYPKTKIEVCKSAVDMEALNSFFQFVSEFEAEATTEDHFRKENQPTNSDYSVAENYKAIRWNDRLVSQLNDFYDQAPIKDECRRNDGQLVQLPPREPVPLEKLLPTKARRCEE